MMTLSFPMNVNLLNYSRPIPSLRSRPGVMYSIQKPESDYTSYNQKSRTASNEICNENEISILQNETSILQIDKKE